ncbi:MAG: TIGR04255 family protein [Rhizomicrobium sp.]
MADALPKFDAPPVVETVISVQFPPIANFSSPMAGWFWKNYVSKLDGEWNRVQEAPPIPDQFELFGIDTGWALPSLQLITGQLPGRTQIVRSDEERMIQVQNSRVILNWKRGTGQYPSYTVLLPEFDAVFAQFMAFSRDAGFDEVVPNQWEITYVNHLPRGELWSSFDDLENIFRDITPPKTIPLLSQTDTVNGNWRYIIGDNLGRLYASLTHVRLPPENDEALRLQFVARGSLASNAAAEMRKCFDLGHEVIVRTFAALTTPSAHKQWKRTQ